MARQNYIPNNNPLLFQDGYPVHWFSEESLAELSSIAGYDIPWQTFRPQIVVRGIKPQEEHRVYSGKIKDAEFINAKPCGRCPVTNVDQETGDVKIGRAMRPLATYKKWRNNKNELKVIFGENMLPAGIAYIRLGDEVRSSSMRDPPLVYGASA